MDVTIICSVCLAASVLTALLGVLRPSDGVGRGRLSDYAWAALIVAAQAVIFWWAGQGLLVEGEGSSLLAAVGAFNAACVASVHAVTSRAARRVAPLGDACADEVASRLVSTLRGLALVLGAATLSVLALEMPHGQFLASVRPDTLFIEWCLVAAATAALYFLAQRRAVACVLVPLTCAGFGLAEHFLYAFKGQPVQPGDLLALGTAASVASGYSYALDSWCLWGLAFAVAAVALLACAASGPAGGSAARGDGAPARYSVRVAGSLSDLVAGLALLAALVTNVTCVDYVETYDVSVNGWAPQVSYETQAYIPCFVSACQVMAPREPEGYTAEGARQLLAAYDASYASSELTGASPERVAAREQFDEERPSVICIMNETFSDLSLFDGMRAGYEGPAFLNSMGDCLLRGNTYVSVQGGGTTNSEFEFLTGNSMANLGAGVYPYNIYNMGITEGLARQFKGLGYDTLAMHPNRPTNWNRENVYAQMGFDEFLSIADFEGADTLRGMVTDRATYDKALDRLRESDGPQFIFDVTMQNHSGYDTGAIPEEYQVSIEGEWGSDAGVNEYASCIARSDEDLRYLIEELSQMDRKVVVLMFGDHQPWFTGQYNDLWFGGEEDAAVHAERPYQTPYVMWANYDVAGCEQVSEERDLAASSLSSFLLHTIGAPLTPFQEAHVEMSWALPVENAVGYEDMYGDWHLSGEVSGVEATDASRADFAWLQFWNMFGDGEGIFEAGMQDEINI